MSYSALHETSNFRPGTVGKGARGFGSQAALQRLLRDAPVPDPACERPWEVSPEDSPEPRVRLANGEECNPCLQRARTRRPECRLLAPKARVRCLRRRRRRVLEGDAPPLSEGVRARVEPLDFRDGRRCSLRGGADEGAGLGGDRPGHPLAPSFGEVDAGEAVDHLPRPLVREKKDAATG